MSRFIYCYSECHYAECRVLFIVMLNVIMLSVVMLNVVVPIRCGHENIMGLNKKFVKRVLKDIFLF